MSIDVLDQILRTRKIAGAQATYRTVCRILTKENIDLKFTTRGPYGVPAWTDGRTISINENYLNIDDLNVVERLHGLVFHEVAHILFSPRLSSDIVKWAKEHHVTLIFNLLEDQRIEKFLIQRYPSVKPWISVMILRWILTLSEPDRVYLLLAGRKHVDKSVRAAARSNFREPSALERVDEIIEEYINLVFPSGYKRAKELMLEFKEIMDQIRVLPPKGNCGDTGTTTIKEGSPVGNNEQRKWRDSENDDSKDDADESEVDESEDESFDEEDSDGDSSNEDDEYGPGNDDCCTCCGGSLEV